MDDSNVAIHPSNADAERGWNGEEGAYWATHADHFDRAVADHHQRLMDAAAIDRGDRVLDVGCGTGRVTRDAARVATAGRALGVDLSERMIDLARRRARVEGIANAAFVRADAQIHRFDPRAFDLVISRTGAMFFGDPIAAFTNLAGALRRGGRVVLLTWQGAEHNEWIRELPAALAAGRAVPVPPADAPGPFALADPQRIRHVLCAAGFTDIAIDGAESPMWFGTDADDATRFVSGLLGWMLDGLDDTERARAVASLQANSAAHQTDAGVLYGSATWTVHARKP